MVQELFIVDFLQFNELPKSIQSLFSQKKKKKTYSIVIVSALRKWRERTEFIYWTYLYKMDKKFEPSSLCSP